MQHRHLEPRVRRGLFGFMAAALAVGLLAMAGLGIAGAQDASPAAGGSRAIACEAAATPAAGEAMASPEATPSGGPEASPAAGFTPTPAGSDAVTGMTATVRELAECLNAGEYAGAAALFTDNFIQNTLGLASAADAEASFAGLERMRIRLLTTYETYDDGTASLIVIYEGFLNTTGAPVAERWVFVVEGGVYKIDRSEPAELPPGFA